MQSELLSFFFPTSSEEGDGTTKVPKIPILQVYNASKYNITTYMGGPRGTFGCDMCGKWFRALDVRHPQYLGKAPLNQLTEVTRVKGGERVLED